MQKARFCVPDLLNKLEPSDYLLKPDPNGGKWVQFTRPLNKGPNGIARR